jgi:hypothetical protein
MKHSRFGLILLLSAAGGWACNADPTDSFRETGTRIVLDPAVVLLNQGANTFVTAQLVDEQGNQLAADLDISDVGSGISVVRDSTFLQTTNGAEISTTKRFVVTGTDLVSTTFTLTGGGQTVNVPVNVVPIGTAVTFSNATPAAEELVTVTPAPGYAFVDTASVSFGIDTAFVVDRAEDGSSMTILPVPGSTGAATVQGITISYLPGAPLSLPTTDSITVGEIAGTADPATAPPIPVPALGDSIFFVDGGTLTGADITGDGGSGAQYYTFTVTEAGDYHFVTNWNNDADLDAIVCFDVACSAIEFAGTGLTQPEDGTLPLDPGTYLFAVVLFAGSAPGNLTLTLTHLPPAAP